MHPSIWWYNWPVQPVRCPWWSPGQHDGTTVIGWIPDTGGTLDISSHFTEANNAPGEAVTFYLEVSLNELGDRKAGEVITFTVTVALHDASV